MAQTSEIKERTLASVLNFPSHLLTVAIINLPIQVQQGFLNHHVLSNRGEICRLQMSLLQTCG